MKRLNDTLMAVAIAAMLFCCIGCFVAVHDAEAYTIRSCTLVAAPSGGQMAYDTGILVPADMLVTKATWTKNDTDAYSAKHFYKGQKVRIEHTVNGVKHYVNTTVRGGFQPGNYVPIKFKVYAKTLNTLHGTGLAKWKAVG